MLRRLLRWLGFARCHWNHAHPLDPLSAEEIQSACAVVKTSKELGSECRFAMVHLHEPAKAEVLAYQPGNAIERSRS